MGKIHNLQGKRFGKWLVIEEIPSDMYENTKWKVKCDCGKETTITGRALVYHKSTHCGCERTKKLTKHPPQQGIPGGKNFKDETGKVYGKLTVIRPTRQNAKKEWYWECKCSCGETTEVRGSHLRSGTIVSCGCVLKEFRQNQNKTHGLTYTPEYVRARNRKRERKEAILDKNWTGVMEHQLRTLFQQCVLCGMTEKEHQTKFGQPLHVDHVHPLKDGNGLYYGNATILCADCNKRKHAKKLEDLDEWARNRLLLTADLFKALFEPKESL